MKKLICKLFRCNWQYFFTGSDCYSERTDIRVCKCCGKIQHYKKIAILPDGEFVWMNMIGFTKIGAKKYWNGKHNVMQRLSYIGLGTHSCGWFKGYITVEGNEKKYGVMWTSERNTHNSLNGSAISVEFTSNGIGWIFKSALTIHPVENKNDKEYWTKWIETKIDYVYGKKMW